MTSELRTHYDALGASATSTQAELRRAYVTLAREFHPDFHIGDDAEAREYYTAQMRTINAAWAVVGDRSRRATYDRVLAEARNARAEKAAVAEAAARRAAPKKRRSWKRSALGGQVVPMVLVALALVAFGIGMLTGRDTLHVVGFASAITGALVYAAGPRVSAPRSRTA